MEGWIVKPRTITEKEAAFVREYLVDKNATQAAIRAGYAVSSAGQHGNLMLRRPVVKAELARQLKAQAERTLITADKVLLDIQSIGDKALRAREFSVALKSRELLGKHHKVFTDRVEHSGPNGGPMEFSEVRRTIVDPKDTPT